MFKIEKERPADAAEIELLLDLVFGEERFAKPSYRLRHEREPVHELSSVVRNHDRLIGTIRFWQVRIGEYGQALLLGPLAVHPTMRGLGAGIALIRDGVRKAAELGFGSVILVGDESYYQRAGFLAEPARGLVLPGLEDYSRLLALELKKGQLSGVTGIITAFDDATKPDWRGAFEGSSD